MTKMAIIGILIFFSAKLTAQSLIVRIKGLENEHTIIRLYSVIQADTIEFKSIGYNNFKIDDSFLDNKVLLKLGNIIFDLGQLDPVARSMFFEYDANADSKCLVVNRVYGDVAKSNFDSNLGCKKFNTISFYDQKLPPNKASIKIKKTE